MLACLAAFSVTGCSSEPKDAPAPVPAADGKTDLPIDKSVQTPEPKPATPLPNNENPAGKPEAGSPPPPDAKAPAPDAGKPTDKPAPPQPATDQKARPGGKVSPLDVPGRVHVPPGPNIHPMDEKNPGKAEKPEMKPNIKRPEMKKLVNWKPSAVSGNFRPMVGSWSLAVGPNVAKMNAKLKAAGKALPKFEITVNGDGTFTFVQGTRINKGVVQVKGDTYSLCTNQVNGRKPMFEEEVKRYDFKVAGKELQFILNGKVGTKFARK